MKISHDGTIDIATGRSRKETNWKNKEWLWSDLVKKLSETHRTAETHAEYMAAKKTRQDEIKDIGGFVGGYLSGGRRKAGNVLHRQLVTLDVDHGSGDVWDDFTLLFGNAACVYSTHKHKPEAPRLRLIVPLDREVGQDEYMAISRRIAGHLGIDNFDHTTFEPSRLMYWPSTPKDGVYVFDYQDGPWLSADEILGSYHDWRDSSEWPVSAHMDHLVQRAIKKQGDPLEKPGLIGAFCRVYDIHQAIETFLPDVYEACAIENRYTYTEGSTAAGLVVYEDKYAFSHHGTDPTSGKLCNAFDLVRIHKYGLKDEDVREGTPVNKMPSYVAMTDFVLTDKAVVKQIGIERLNTARADFTDVAEDEEEWVEENDDWLTEMDVDKKGNYQTTVQNIQLILENDSKLRGKIAYNELSQKTVVLKALPWDLEKLTEPRNWTDDDWGCLRCYLAKDPYNLNRTPKLEDVMSLIKVSNRFHPIRQYIESLKWDGEKRLDMLLIEYLGAENSPYVKAVTRKAFVAAVARVFEPGKKFDHVLTLVGKQGIGKSTIIKKLGKHWYTDTFNFHMLRGKEAYEQIQGVWLVEIGEMAGLKKAEVEGAKNFITSTEDTFRPAYGRETVTRKRQCVFFGTTNDPDFLRKANGNRRFWPVDLHEQKPVKSVFKDLTSYEINQVWAEAAVLYAADESLNLSHDMEEEAFRVQQQHEETDAQVGIIEEYLNKLLPESWDSKPVQERVAYINYHDELSEEGTVMRNKVCAAEIWCECFKKPKGDLGRQNGKYIHELMREVPGWKMHKSKIKFSGYGVQVGYVRVEEVVENDPKTVATKVKTDATEESFF